MAIVTKIAEHFFTTFDLNFNHLILGWSLTWLDEEVG